MSRLSWQNTIWFTLYAITMLCIVLGIFWARQSAMNFLGGPVQQAHWETFRQEMAKHSEAKGPVKRKVPKSLQPPGLLLLRDYFVVCLSGALFFGTCLFMTAMFLLRGAMKTRPAGPAESVFSSQDRTIKKVP